MRYTDAALCIIKSKGIDGPIVTYRRPGSLPVWRDGSGVGGWELGVGRGGVLAAGDSQDRRKTGGRRPAQTNDYFSIHEGQVTESSQNPGASKNKNHVCRQVRIYYALFVIFSFCVELNCNFCNLFNAFVASSIGLCGPAVFAFRQK